MYIGGEVKPMKTQVNITKDYYQIRIPVSEVYSNKTIRRFLSEELNIVASANHEVYLCRFTGVELFKNKEKIYKHDFNCRTFGKTLIFDR